jgi:hypothetical protein
LPATTFFAGDDPAGKPTSKSKETSRSKDRGNPDSHPRRQQEGNGEMFAFELDTHFTGSDADAWGAASCRDDSGSLTQLFFSDELTEIAAAKAICATCPLIEPCLAGALQRREPFGVWGGQLFLNGRILAQKRKRGRPRKNPPVAAEAEDIGLSA